MLTGLQLVESTHRLYCLHNNVVRGDLKSLGGSTPLFPLTDILPSLVGRSH